MKPALSLAILAAFALSLSGCGKPKVETAFGEKVRAYLLEHPEVLLEAQEQLALNQAKAEGAQALAAIKANRMAIERDSRDMVLNPDGKITVVEFFDYDCSFCKLVSGQVMAYAKANPDVRFVFKDLTIFGEPSQYAAAGAQLVREPERYAALHSALMNQRPLNDETVTQVLAANGVDTSAAKARQASPAGKAYLADVAILAKKLSTQVGTPMFVIGDAFVPSADWPAVQKAIEAQRKA